MGKIKITVKKARQILNDLSKISKEPNDKLSYAIKKNEKLLLAQVEPLIENLNAELQDLAVVHAETGEKGILLMDEKGNYSYKPEGMKKLNVSRKKLVDEHNNFEFEFESYYSPACERLLELDAFLLEELEGVLIASEMVN